MNLGDAQVTRAHQFANVAVVVQQFLLFFYLCLLLVQRLLSIACKLSQFAALCPQGTESPWEGEKYKLGGSKSHRGKNVKSGGSDPTFSAFSRPKSSWGRSRPSARRIVPAVFSTVTGSSEETHITTGGTVCRSLRK